jgi:hypothetical protein
MTSLLLSEYINYLYSQRPLASPCNMDSLCIKAEITSDEYFDIMDKLPAICQPLGTGSATYHNLDGKTIQFVDFEDFVNKLPADLVKGIKRCDFIAYDTLYPTFFLLNELSQSTSSGNKLNDARQQLHSASFSFSQIPHISRFINTFEKKQCIFSNKQKLISITPSHIADAFSEIQNYLPEPIRHKFQPITKLGFELIETAIVEV